LAGIYILSGKFLENNPDWADESSVEFGEPGFHAVPNKEMSPTQLNEWVDEMISRHAERPLAVMAASYTGGPSIVRVIGHAAFSGPDGDADVAGDNFPLQEEKVVRVLYKGLENLPPGRFTAERVGKTLCLTFCPY
jgi:hypothetical protein